MPVMENQITLNGDEILVLRNCRDDGSSHNGFVWPESGFVECPDWVDNEVCGNGLHGLPWGVGSVSYFYEEPAKWLVFVASTAKGRYVHGVGDFTDKCKSASARVVYCGEKQGAIDLIAAHLPAGLAMNFATQTAGDESTQTAGYASTQTAGYESTQTAGYASTQTAGDESTQKAGKNSVQVSIWWSDGQWHSACRMVPIEDVDKWCRVENGIWRDCTVEESATAELKIK